MYRLTTFIIALIVCFKLVHCGNVENNKISNGDKEKEHKSIPCTCGIFLSGQLVKGKNEQPKGNPVLLQETDHHYLSGSAGNRMCITKCLEVVSILQLLVR